MKQFTTCLLWLTLAIWPLCSVAQQPKWVKKARKAQLNVITYDAQGQLLRSTNGFFIGSDGTALADYASFKGAAKACVIDEKGTEWPVRCILGASSLYDVVRFAVDCKKPAALTIASTASAKGANAYVQPYLSNKSGLCETLPIEEVATFNDIYSYYTLGGKLPEKSTSCPVMNEAGEVIGLLQMAASANEQKSYVLSAAFARDLTINALSATAADYRDIPLRKALPTDAGQAASFIYLIGTRDTTLYLTYVDDYIQHFPSSANGYTMKAEMLAAQHRFDEADATWQQGLQAKAKGDELHYSRARTLFAAVQENSPCPEAWSLENALTEIQTAVNEQPQPIYTALQGHILYAAKRYDEACASFMDVTHTNMRSADYFLYAAQCRQMQADTAAVLALQDSAVNCFTKPYVADAAPALLMRANTYLSMKRFREAVLDLNDYEHLKRNELNANFYYRREQAEMQCRMFQQALDDIERAVRMEPREPLFLAELAAVHFRFGQLDETIDAAQRAIALDDAFADAHRILGIALRQQGREPDARKALQRASELGDTIAEGLLQSNDATTN